ncbi:hypothetical protein DR62_08090 [Burkholderia thailandensis]|nr:hypothetical protein DR62_08090 [Burkholderia thailandensis]
MRQVPKCRTGTINGLPAREISWRCGTRCPACVFLSPAPPCHACATRGPNRVRGKGAAPIRAADRHARQRAQFARMKPDAHRPLPAHLQTHGMTRTNAEFRGIGQHRR